MRARFTSANKTEDRASARHAQRGFTLAELLAAIAIIALLVGLSFPVLAPIRRAGRMASCSSNLHQIGVAYKEYSVDYDGYPTSLMLARGGYFNDRRILECPDDWTEVPNGVASSYTYRYLVPPDYRPITQVKEVDGGTMLAFCDHHLGRTKVHLGNDAVKWSEPRYPYYVVLRAGGAVSRVRSELMRYKKIPLQGGFGFEPTFPGEPGYDPNQPDALADPHDHDH